MIEQYPLAKSKVTSGDKIFIKTEGKDITLPNLVGWSKKEVQTYASLAGIQLILGLYRFCRASKHRYVVSQSPKARCA